MNPVVKDKWADFIGQGDSIDLLKKMDRAGKRSHTLLNGPPGTGKTTLAKILSNGSLITCIGSSLRSADRATAMITTAIGQDIDTFFIDEVHSAKLSALEVLYPVMEEQLLHVGGKSEPAPIYIIAATTDGGRLPKPFVDRFGIEVRLKQYDNQEMDRIIEIMSKKFKVFLTDPMIKDISKRSLGIPRTARRLLNRLSDFGTAYTDWDKYIEIIKLTGIDSDGLSVTERIVLETIWKSFGRGPVGLKTLSHAAQMDEFQLTKYVEPILVRLGYLTIEKAGRKLTSKGLERAISIT